MEVGILSKVLKFLPIDLLFLVVMFILAIGWLRYQHKYVCEPAINHAIEEQMKTVFDSRQQIPRFVVKEYDWAVPWYSYVKIELDTGERCSVSLSPEKGRVLSCWGQYEVTGFQCSRTEP